MWKRKTHSAGLTAADSTIWHTVAINQAIDDNAYDQLPTVATPFPPRLASTEQMLVYGDFSLRDARGIERFFIGSGTLYVSTDGFYMHTAAGLHPWRYSAITTAQLTAPGSLVFSGDSDNGPITWAMESGWAELAFTLWARTVHPQHPQYAGHQWIPAEWADRVQASGYQLPTHSNQQNGSD